MLNVRQQCLYLHIGERREQRAGQAVVGMASRRTTVTAPKIRLHAGATIYGAIIASEQGGTFA